MELISWLQGSKLIVGYASGPSVITRSLNSGQGRQKRGSEEDVMAAAGSEMSPAWL